jgi:group II intron reverse transcriptase/maturase
MSPGLQKVVEMAKRDPSLRFLALAHLIDEAALNRAYERLRKDAAVGVDGITKEQYGERLGDNLRALHQRLREKRYRHQPIRRVHIPKGPDKTRPIGISTTEDKIVQHAIAEVLGAIYEQDFLPCSYGFRPGRAAHDAIRDLNQTVYGGRVRCILEADIRSYFDSIDRKMLREMLQQRVADGSLMRLVGKCLNVGVLDGAQYAEPDVGTAQGSVLSPLLGNIYLHYVLDVWFEREVKPRLRGHARLIRYADDFVIAFEQTDDAHDVMRELTARMERYGLALHPEKTRLVPFERPPDDQRGGKGPATFDFLGFTMSWRRKRMGGWRPGFETRRARVRRFLEAVAEYCRSHRHDSVKTQHNALCRRIDGHFNYFGVNGNSDALARVARVAKCLWKKWLSRRSQRGMKWERFDELLLRLPWPTPTIRVPIWA